MIRRCEGVIRPFLNVGTQLVVACLIDEKVGEEGAACRVDGVSEDGEGVGIFVFWKVRLAFYCGDAVVLTSARCQKNKLIPADWEERAKEG